MSSDSSDSEGERTDTRRASSSDSGSNKAPASPPPEDSKGPKTPGSPVSNKSFESLSPEGPQSPSSPRPSRSRSRSNSGARSPSNSPDRAASHSRSAARSEASRSRSASPAPKRGPRSPPENFDDDGRSNISSGSSILSGGSPKVNGDKTSPSKVPFSVPNAEDLSDDSDIGEVEEDAPGSDKDSRDGGRGPGRRERGERDSRTADDDGEQLDFEVEDKEDGECEKEKPPPQTETRTEKSADAGGTEDGEEKSGDEGEVKEEDAESLEEGEVSDDGDPKPEKPPICRFYSRGACTWGNNCRFLHPGVTDKGNYSMFETTRPIVAGNGIGMYAPEPRPYPLMMPARVIGGAYGPPPVRREDPAGVESAWERGLRQAKELMRISTKRKESDMDFEDKKMNMSIGQDEMDKENDYYTRVASPAEPESWPSRLSPRRDEGELRRPVRVVERYEDILPEPVPAPFDRFDHRRVRDPEYMLRREKYGYPEEDARKSKKMVREVIVQRGEKGKRVMSPDGGRKPDEWRDPWMRTRSPGHGKHRPRKVSYSSGSSSYSGSSSRSSSNSSYSSYSRSRSGSRSGSRSPVGRRRRSPPPTGIPVRPKGPEGKFKPVKTVAVAVAAEKPAERSMLMNPPAPSPLRTKRPLTPNTAIRKVGLNPPAPTVTKPLTKKSSKIRSKKSRSSSSGSSGSSSDSSHSSYSSSSSGSSPHKSPPARQAKKGDADAKSKEQRLAAKVKDKVKDKQPTASIAGKKRPAPEDPPPKGGSPEKNAGSKKGSSRREELLKQLKAVEDAIARKRSKI